MSEKEFCAVMKALANYMKSIYIYRMIFCNSGESISLTYSIVHEIVHLNWKLLV